MRTSLLMMLLSIALTVAAQTTAHTGNAAPTQAKPRITVDVRPAALPTEQEVLTYLKGMFGQDPTVTFKVLGISASEVPGVAHVVVQIGGPQQPPTHLYVMPDREHAIVGEVVPYGAQPFAPAQRKLEAQAKGPRTGAAKPRVTIVEFSDMQCPHCKNGHPILEKLLADTPGAQLVFQPFPLSIHDWASKAALMGECVALQKPTAFWLYVKAVFDKQDQINAANAPEMLQQIATATGANGAQAATCAQSPSTAKKLQESIDLGFALGVNSTPTIFINGRKVQGFAQIPYDDLKKLVEFQATQK